ncbi:steroid 3-ketoacyl-CoA thiolase [Solirubrobacter ginsenosidimutans]|uniref:Steroid 3-ketoacyl-CoA thiolase n=1 Tax=Solirubrobacter ginsenosidimutans TaxID=490573 RepID=A0A9X3MUZ9_9ACTN|nr:steroid 3-ketoacyl-CoA thiolase [Solirubrobacter ginsenosidimutans]MDA0160328.1 steroid 3-ketoacyl-CoA thiolase [Solirubrobacter ginsenosidimutans]
MPDVMLVDAVRTPVGRRNGALSTIHPVNLLAQTLTALFERSGTDPAAVGQVIGGCVSQVGEQAVSTVRSAWLTAGLPIEVPATTIDAQCGSSQQATSLASALVGAGLVDVAVGCGVEAMSRIPIGSNSKPELGLGNPLPEEYSEHYEPTTQFEGAERIADRWGITRADTDAFGVRSQSRAAAAWEDGRFDEQVVAVGPVTRDEGLRATTLEGLGTLKPVARPDGVHTAGTSSQISDGAAAVLLASAERAAQLGLSPRARIKDSLLVGSDPELMLTGPIPATRALLERNGMTLADIDLVEINEAFASVVLAWQRELDADLDKVNVNGGAIALGHPLGATGAVLITKAINELERRDGTYALVTMCCGGGLGTGMLIERV